MNKCLLLACVAVSASACTDSSVPTTQPRRLSQYLRGLQLPAPNSESSRSESSSSARGAVAYSALDSVARELALVKVRAPHHRYAELLDMIQLYSAVILDDSHDGLIIELRGRQQRSMSGRSSTSSETAERRWAI